jgi:hypothetical protein
MYTINFAMLCLLTLIYGLFWLWNLSGLLQRKDLDPVTKLTWVVVLIFVPFFGLFFYRDQVPMPAPERTNDSSAGRDVRGTPWEANPGHKL